jgi:hypothetical protein
LGQKVTALAWIEKVVGLCPDADDARRFLAGGSRSEPLPPASTIQDTPYDPVDSE